MELGFPCQLILLLSAVECAASLQCWKCIADNCDEDPETNYKAGKMTCTTDDSSCMKVEYSLNSNHSGIVLKSFIRTCSAGPCIPVTDDQFAKCSSRKAFYVLGCIKRTCCDDRDLCNGGNRDVIDLWVLLTLVCQCVVVRLMNL